MDIVEFNRDTTLLLHTIVDTWHFDAFKAQLDAPTDALQARVGFVGEFSSGKSTLINAVLGASLLPSRSTPTTGNIIQIEADPRLTAPEYWLTDSSGNGSCETVSADDFATRACGDKQGTLRLRLPPRGILQPGIQLIDSPGVNALVSNHADITLAQLSLLDGLVICLHCEMGTVPANLLTFLEREEIQRIAHKLMFVLTAADQKVPTSVLRVRDSMAQALVRVLPEASDQPNIILTRALDALNGEPEGIAQFVQTFNATFLARAGLLREERRAMQLKECAGLVKTALQAYEKALVYSDADFKQQLDEGNALADKLLSEKSEQVRRLEEWYQGMRMSLQQVGERFAPVLARTAPGQLDAAFASLQAALDDVTLTQMQRYAPEAGIACKALPAELQHTLASALQAHAKYVAHGVTAATMIAVTVATAGTGTAAITATEVTAAAATQTAAANAVKEIGKVAMKTAIKKGSEAAATSVVGNLLQTTVAHLATTIKAINPFEMAGDVALDFFNGKETRAVLPQLTARLADAYHADMLRHLENTCFGPIEEALSATETGMLEARKVRSASLDAFAQQRARIVFDLNALATLEGAA